MFYSQRNIMIRRKLVVLMLAHLAVCVQGMNRPGSTGVSPTKSTGLPTFYGKRSFHLIGVVSLLLLGVMLIVGGLYFHAVVPLGMGVGLFGVGVIGGLYLRRVKLPPMSRPGLGELDR